MLVNQATVGAEVPIDGGNRRVAQEVVKPGFLLHLANGGLLGRLAGLQVALGESTVAVTVEDEEESGDTIPPHNNATRAGLAARPARAH